MPCCVSLPQSCRPYLVDLSSHLRESSKISSFRMLEFIAVGVGLSVSAAVGYSLLNARRQSRAAKEGLYVFGETATAEMDAEDSAAADYPGGH